jgi:2-methylcitrate dehydratase PrpD
MDESFLRYTDIAAAIQLAKSRGLTTAQIVRALSANMSHGEALTLARRAAPLLEIQVSTFMRLRRNE